MILEDFKWDVNIHQYSRGMNIQLNFPSDFRSERLAKSEHEKS